MMAGVGLWLGAGMPARAVADSLTRDTLQTKAAMATHASGSFDVKLNPQAGDESLLGRLTIDKTFHGDLEATSKGQMLAASTDVPGSAGYVAMERVTGTLGGRSGSFVLQHTGTMTRGDAELLVTVVPTRAPGSWPASPAG